MMQNLCNGICGQNCAHHPNCNAGEHRDVCVHRRADGSGTEIRQPRALLRFFLVGMTLVGVILLVRRTLILQSEATLRTGATDVGTLNRWRSGYIVTYALSESLALFGLILRFMGFNLVQVAPFYLAGFILMLFFGPRQPSELS